MAEKIHIPQGLKLQREIIVLFNEIASRTQNLGSDGGVSSLDAISDVSITSPETGDVLQYDGTQWENGETPAATTTKRGGVKQAGPSSDASESSVSVTASDVAGTADTSYGQGEADMINALKALANELKTDLTQVVTDLNAIKDSLNNLKSVLRSAGILSA